MTSHPRTLVPALFALLHLASCVDPGPEGDPSAENQVQAPDAASRPDHRESPGSTPTTQTPTTPVLIDGLTAEWPSAEPVNAFADESHIFIRFNPDDGAHAIQAAPFTTRILIDADNNPATGRPFAALGADAAVELSPLNPNGETGIGAWVTLYTADAAPMSAGHADLNFVCLPTHAAASYEARIDRAALPALLVADAASVRVEQTRPDGTVLWSGNATVTLPAASGTGGPPVSTSLTIPLKPDNAVRILSQNIHFSSPLENPDDFRRTITVLDPDIILFQEWFDTPETAIQGWVTTNLGRGWTVIAPDADEGVAIATSLPVVETAPDLLPDPDTEHQARFVSALVDTPAGPLLVASIHLKCCGGAGSPEDARRAEQAAAINRTLADLLQRHPNAGVVIGGDYNLVGARAPLEILAQGLARDGSDLAPVHAVTLGDPTAVTWADDKSRFSPGRLDWVLVDPRATPIDRAFILDTRRLPDRLLQAANLERNDSAASDHLPVVIDLAAVP